MQKNLSPENLPKEAKKVNKRIIAIICVQEGDKFRLDYLFDGKEKYITLRTYVPVKKPFINTIMDFYPLAEIFEREIHDFFGVEFKGNRRLHDKLFLPENYKGKPPLKKEHSHA